jgi:hypothetical protein
MMISIKNGVLGATLLASVPLLLLATPATARDCSGDDVYKIYEQATSKGHQDAQDHEDSRAHHHYRHMHLSSDQKSCYKEGYENGYANESADMRKGDDDRDDDNGDKPRHGTNERAYYDDGCKAGKSDAKDNMSNAYQRHGDDYDSRFEPYFKQGFEHCWSKYR